MTAGRFAALSLSAFGLVAALTAGGCGGSLKTHTVRGKVVLEGGDVKKLAQGYVELQRTGEPATRSSGEIMEDGSFELTTLHEGHVLSGVPEGTHAVRIVLPGDQEDEDASTGDPNDDDEAPAFRPKVKKAGKPVIHPRFRKFNTSNITIQVPTEGEVTITVSAK